MFFQILTYMNPILFLLLFGEPEEIPTASYSYNKEWFESVEQEINDLQFQEHFRMNRSEFNEILEILYAKAMNISKDTFRRDLLLFLTYTGHTVVYRLIRELFGMPLTTAFRIINRMTNFIYLHAQDYVFFT